MNFLFLLGRTPDLSYQELQSLLPGHSIEKLSSQLVSLSLEDEAYAEKIFTTLGGSIKVMRVEGEFTDVTEEKLLEYVTAYFAEYDRPTFAIAEFGRDTKPKLSVNEIKKQLKERGIGSRFIESTREGLSASVFIHQKVVELNVIQLEEKVVFAKTLATQDIDDWTRRDRHKPYADRKKGMLPPKLARIMVNLAIGAVTPSTPPPVLYDPFCGSGTVLLEGLMRDCEVIGSDLDQKAIMGSQNNLNWFFEIYEGPPGVVGRVFVADATTVKPEQVGKKVDLIVTEPFLGKQTPAEAQLPNIFRGLEKLYLGVFKNWTKILQSSARVVIVFPYVQAGKHAYSLESLIDKLKALGYTSEFEPILYSRPDATVQRQIWSFKYTGK